MLIFTLDWYKTDDNIFLGQRLVQYRVDSKKLDNYFLLYALQTEEVRNQLKKLSAGSTVEHVSVPDCENIEIPLPPLEEQKRIAEIARKCDRIRRTRRYTQQLSDTYLQSVFLEMFAGAKSKSWNRVKVEEVVDRRKNSIRTGPFGSQLLHEEFQERGEIAVLGIDNVVQNYFAWNKPRFITRNKYKQLKRYTVYPGDVLITIMGTCGRCAVVPGNIPLAINTKHLCCITLDQTKCLPIYLKHFFLGHPLALDQLGISERGAVMPGLNMSLIKDLEMTLPPLDLQEKFVKVVQHYNLINKKRREAERQAEHLFQTILHRAFRGEL